MYQIDVETYPSGLTKPTIYVPGQTHAGPQNNLFGRHPCSEATILPHNVLAHDMSRLAGTSYTHKPRGSWRIQRIYANPGRRECPR
jgi:hypothetical protein